MTGPLAAAISNALQTPLPAAVRNESESPPRSARMWLDLGLTCVALEDGAAAIAALREAVALKPLLAAAWRALGDLLEASGDAEGAREARAAQLAGEGDDADARRLANAPSRGKIQAAETQIRERLARVAPALGPRTLRMHLKTAPTDVAALRMLAEFAVGGQHYPAAEMLLERALELVPGYATARQNLAFVLLAQGKATAAIPHIEKLLAQEPRHANYRTLLASSLATIGEFERAIAIFESLIKEGPRPAKFWLSYAHALRYSGRRADSVRAYRKCLELAPALGEAYWSLANLKNERFSEADVATMREGLATAKLANEDRVHLHYALGSALEQAGDFEGSFDNYAKGARAQRSVTEYSADDWSAQMARTRQFFTREFFAERAQAGWPDAAPIFILGLPRTGSTLIEQILASHSQVEGTMELPEISKIAREIGGGHDGYPEDLAALNHAAIAELGERFIERTRIYRKTDKVFFIDKMPTNWPYVGLISLILPNAKIIDTRRHPMASCFSAFKQLFGHGAAYSYDLTDLGRYYTDYLRVMAHFDEVLPGRIHRINYETMVADAEGETRRLLNYCKLEFEPACLRFWESKRAVGTPSSEQVRQPIFREGLEQWRNYEPWLGPLSAALAEPGTG